VKVISGTDVGTKGREEVGSLLDTVLSENLAGEMNEIS
jgi:hypothetical protein